MINRNRFWALFLVLVLVSASANVASADRPGSIRVLDEYGQEVQSRTFGSIDKLYIDGIGFEPGTNYIRVVESGHGNSAQVGQTITMEVNAEGGIAFTSLASIGFLPDGDYKVQIAQSSEFKQKDIKDDFFKILKQNEDPVDPGEGEAEIEDEEVPGGPISEEEPDTDVEEPVDEEDPVVDPEDPSVEEEPAPESDDEEIIADEEVPVGPVVLPKTSGASPALFYGLGLALVALGVKLRRD